jgi:hypothetical protein
MASNAFFQYLVLPFGWRRSGHWICRLVQRFWMMVKTALSYRALSYVDDFAIAPSLGRAASVANCRKASRHIGELLRRYGLTRHPLKRVWGAGSQCLQHLGFEIDTHRGLFGVPAAKWTSAYLHVRRHLYCLVTTRAATPVTTPVLPRQDACSDTCILIFWAGRPGAS